MLPHVDSGAAHVHIPCWHTRPPSQRRPQAPQFAESVCRFAHALPHNVVAPAHLHAPIAHACPVAQARLQALQWRASLCTSTHAPEQAMSPNSHIELQLPPEQTWPGAHAVPHAPQFFGSELNATHAPLHSAVPVGQRHAPVMHTRPAPHARPQAPQFALSLAAFTHTADPSAALPQAS